MTDILDLRTPEWMNHEGRNCAIPDEFTADETRAAADMWFPTEVGAASYAKRLCLDCPVRMQCFMYALERPELEGIWGQTSTGQRARIRAQKRRAA